MDDASCADESLFKDRLASLLDARMVPVCVRAACALQRAACVRVRVCACAYLCVRTCARTRFVCLLAWNCCCVGVFSFSRVWYVLRVCVCICVCVHDCAYAGAHVRMLFGRALLRAAAAAAALNATRRCVCVCVCMCVCVCVCVQIASVAISLAVIQVGMVIATCYLFFRKREESRSLLDSEAEATGVESPRVRARYNSDGWA
jgi:hypothetical protein